MLRRYRKIEVDSRFSAAEDRGRYSVCGDKFVKLMSFISFYLLLSPFNYKRKLNKLRLRYESHCHPIIKSTACGASVQ